LERLREPFDFLGLNYYTRGVMRADPTAWPTFASKVPQPQHPTTETGWEVYPEGLEETLLWLHRRYGPIPLYVTENGAAFPDPPSAKGEPVLEDPLRVRYLRDHIHALAHAREAGADVRGYFVWSLLDNFEWAHGFSKRFGMVHVDYSTQRRTPKASARFFTDAIRTRGSSRTAI
jgi:beta-glucosidase